MFAEYANNRFAIVAQSRRSRCAIAVLSTLPSLRYSYAIVVRSLRDHGAAIALLSLSNRSEIAAKSLRNHSAIA
jgi:hypothetical protein